VLPFRDLNGFQYHPSYPLAFPRGQRQNTVNFLSAALAIALPDLAVLPAWMVRKLVVAPRLLAAGGTCEALMAAAQGSWPPICEAIEMLR
jgi:hypothetical protein